MISVGFMQLYAVGLLFLTETMAVQANHIAYLTCFLDFLFMARIFAAYFVGNKLGMVNCYQSTFDHFIRHLMAILAAGLNQPIATLIVLEEMARKTRIVVHTEVFIPFEVAVTRTARNSYPVNYFFDVILVSELDTAVVDIFC
jgi:hypothetical protein